MHYTVLDFALDAARNRMPSAKAVVTYLQKCWPFIPSHPSPRNPTPPRLEEDPSASALDTSPQQGNPSASVFAVLD